MNLEKEIRIAKLQIMWTVAVSMCALFLIIRAPDMGLLWDFVFLVLWVPIWYLGALSLRNSVEAKEKEGIKVDSSKTFEQAHSEAVDKEKEE